MSTYCKNGISNLINMLQSRMVKNDAFWQISEYEKNNYFSVPLPNFKLRNILNFKNSIKLRPTWTSINAMSLNYQ